MSSHITCNRTRYSIKILPRKRPIYALKLSYVGDISLRNSSQYLKASRIYTDHYLITASGSYCTGIYICNSSPRDNGELNQEGMTEILNANLFSYIFFPLWQKKLTKRGSRWFSSQQETCDKISW